MEKQAVEFDIFAFVKMRCKELGINREPHELFDEAATLRTKMASHQAKRLYALSFGGIGGILGTGVLTTELQTLSLSISTGTICAALIIPACWAFNFWLHGEKDRRFPSKSEGRAVYEIENSNDLFNIFQPVSSGRAQLALIAASDRVTAFTPASNRPIEHYISGKALEDAWFPGVVLHRLDKKMQGSKHIEDGIPEYVVIVWQEVSKTSQRSGNKWKRYYLWHQTPEFVANIFDQAVTIYQDDSIKRHKARVAVLLVSEHFSECRAKGFKVKSQSKLTKMLFDRLKFEAHHLLLSGEIDEVAARKLERVGISGEPKTIDPADPRASLNDGSAGWFEQLLSGINLQILPPLRDEALRVFPTLPKYIDD